MLNNRLITFGLLMLTLSGCGGSASIAPPVNPNVTTIAMSITNGTNSSIAMSPESVVRSCMRQVPAARTLAPHQRWQGTIALDNTCPKQRWSFGIAFSASFPAASAEWSRSGDGRWLLLYLTSELGLRAAKGQDGLFDITLVRTKPPR